MQYKVLCEIEKWPKICKQEKIWVKNFTEEFDGKEGGYSSLSWFANVGSKLGSDAEGHRAVNLWPLFYINAVSTLLL